MLSTAASITAKEIAVNWFACADGVGVSFDIIPEAALAYLKEKSLTIAGVESDAVKQAVKEALIDTIKTGKSFSEFKAEIDSIFDSFGITKLSQMHLQTVYRTNVFAAYSIGEYQQVQSMADRFPLVYYSAIHDSRSRHLPLEGYYPVSVAPIPPVDYNCRCTLRYIHISMITGREVVFEIIQRPDLIRFDQRDNV